MPVPPHITVMSLPSWSCYGHDSMPSGQDDGQADGQQDSSTG